jgi:hypothetical protein
VPHCSADFSRLTNLEHSADILSHVNILNVSLRKGGQSSQFREEKNKSVTKKLGMWSQRLNQSHNKTLSYISDLSITYEYTVTGKCKVK